ncbi:SH3 domain-containing protein [Pseudobacillus sp. 179-B 2D1 NHS]|uniref:SH3 domain-containing protein n=1 Tax=Pseudobacillus sp. 179-B 2D1 NHS TaxID=3374292 RepID=UPI00387A726C
MGISKQIKRTVLAMLMTALAFSIIFSSNVEAAGTKTGYVDIKSGVLNVRSGPGGSYKVIATLKNNTKLTIYSQTKNGWSETRVNNKKGYVSTGYLRFYSQMSNQEAKRITDRAIGTMDKLSYERSYTRKQIHSVLATSYTASYIDALIKYDMWPTGKKDKYGNPLYEWIATDFPAFRIWGFDWYAQDAPKPPTVTYYTKNGAQYLNVYQNSEDDMYEYEQKLFLIKQYSKSSWKIYSYQW